MLNGSMHPDEKIQKPEIFVFSNQLEAKQKLSSKVLSSILVMQTSDSEIPMFPCGLSNPVQVVLSIEVNRAVM